MSEKDRKEINLAIYTIAAYLKCYIHDVNRKLKELMEHVNSLKSDQVKTLMELQNNQEVVTERFHEFQLMFSEPGELVILTNIKISMNDLKKKFSLCRRIVDNLNKKCNELMIEFRKSAGKGGVLRKRGRQAEQGSSVLRQAIVRLKNIQEDYESETRTSGSKGQEGGGVLMEGLKIQEDHVMNDGSDIGGQRENVSDSKSMELGIERFKIQEDYVSETSKSERKGEVLMEGLKIQEGYVENKTNDGSDIGGQKEDVSDLTELGIERFNIQENHVSETSKSERKGEILMEGLEIQEGYVENKMNDGSDIGGQKEDVSDSKNTEKIERFKRQVEYMVKSLTESPPEFDRSGNGSDVNLEKITESGTSNDVGGYTNTEGLEQKICRLINEAKWLLEKDKDNDKNRLIDWIKILKATNDRSVELGSKLCFMLVDLRFIMSGRKELMAKFQEFISSLEIFFKDENFMVISKMIEVLEMTDGEMRMMMKKGKWVERVVNVSDVKEGFIDVSQIDHLLVSILIEVLNLGYVLMHPPDLNMSKKDVICLEELKAIDTKIAELKESSTVIFGLEEMKRVEFHTRALHGRIKEMWNQFEESLEENEPKID